MNLPNLPIDNLYKFLALTGLFMTIIGFGFNQYREYQHDLENVSINKVKSKYGVNYVPLTL